MTPRLEKLLKMIDAAPADAFLLYGAALEYKNRSAFSDAVAFLDRAIAADPTMCYAYYQKGQVLEETGDADTAATAYRAGLKMAHQIGDAKAAGELEQALSIVE